MKMTRYTAAPHPFVLQPDLPVEGTVHTLGVTLIGKADAHLPYLIHALGRAGQAGIGKGRTPMKLIEVRQAQQPFDSNSWTMIYQADGVLEWQSAVAAVIPPAPAAVRLRFTTPLRLQGDDHLVTLSSFRFSHLFGALLRRISMLSYFHTDVPLDIDFAGLMESARHHDAAAVNLSWKEWARYSSRQHKRIQMGGLVGEVVLDLEQSPEFWPYLWLGQWVHAGKGTSMGLGRYTLETASLPDSAGTRI
jgi:hypothetical protein